jgi:ketosteroid isomerase-like protein
MPEDLVDKAREIVRAWNDDDLEAALELVDPEGEIHFPELVFPGLESSYRGHEGFRKWWRDAREPFEYWRSEPLDFIRDGDKVVARVHFEAKGEGSGATVEMDLANFWTFRDGLVVRFEAYLSLEQALKAAGISDPG